MTKKHFVALAKTIKEMPATDEEKLLFAKSIAKVCQEFNPAFNEARFIEACGFREITISSRGHSN